MAHGDDEHILKADLYAAVAGYKKLVKESLNPTRRPPALLEVKVEEVTVVVETPVSSPVVIVQKAEEL